MYHSDSNILMNFHFVIFIRTGIHTQIMQSQPLENTKCQNVNSTKHSYNTSKQIHYSPRVFLGKTRCNTIYPIKPAAIVPNITPNLAWLSNI